MGVLLAVPHHRVVLVVLRQIVLCPVLVLVGHLLANQRVFLVTPFVLDPMVDQLDLVLSLYIMLCHLGSLASPYALFVG
jgi:hypothetical protein